MNEEEMTRQTAGAGQQNVEQPKTAATAIDAQTADNGATAEKPTEVETELTAEEKPHGRKAMRQRMKAKYGDRNWDEGTEGAVDDDAMADQAMADYDELDGKMKQRDEADKKLGELFEKNPQSASFLMGMARGEDFLSNLQKNFGNDIVEAMQNPEKLDRLKKANAEYQQKVAKSKELQKNWETNMSKSLDDLAMAQEQNGMSDDDVQKGMDALIKVVNEYNEGKLSMETIQMFLKAANHDSDVAAAQHHGEVAGRNANIEERMRKRAGESDGAPALGGQSNGFGSRGQRKMNSLFDVANGAR